MTLTTFSELLLGICRSGVVLQQGTIAPSQIVSATKTNVCYLWNTSKISVPISDLYDAAQAFKGRRIRARDLVDFRPQIFGRARHPCNCTFLFCLLLRLGLAEELQGRGGPKSPFSIFVRNEERAE